MSTLADQVIVVTRGGRPLGAAPLQLAGHGRRMAKKYRQTFTGVHEGAVPWMGRSRS